MLEELKNVFYQLNSVQVGIIIFWGIISLCFWVVYVIGLVSIIKDKLKTN
jgi:hypothetical protein